MEEIFSKWTIYDDTNSYMGKRHKDSNDFYSSMKDLSMWFQISTEYKSLNH